jgi:hypothetical protein
MKAASLQIQIHMQATGSIKGDNRKPFAFDLAPQLKEK